MSDEWTRMDELERAVDAELTRVAHLLDALPSPAVLERVKSAVRCELDETWLAGQSMPEPAPPVLRRVRSAVRRELAQIDHETSRRSAANRHGARSRTWSQGIASLAAAAMVAVCVGVIRQAGLSRPDAPPANQLWVQASDPSVELFVQAADDVFAGDGFTKSILTELDAIEARLAGSRATGNESATGYMEFERALDELLEEPETSDSPLGLGGRREDRLG